MCMGRYPKEFPCRSILLPSSCPLVRDVKVIGALFFLLFFCHEVVHFKSLWQPVPSSVCPLMRSVQSLSTTTLLGILLTAVNFPSCESVAILF